MSDLTHLFKVGQEVRCNLDGNFFPGTVTETAEKYIIVDIPEICDHCMFMTGFNIGDVYPEYNFND